MNRLAACVFALFALSNGSQRHKRQDDLLEPFTWRNIWPKGEVPFEIDFRHFSHSEIRILVDAMQLIERQTCVRFKPANLFRDDHFIKFTNGTSCSALVGRRTYMREQEVWLPSWCMQMNNVVHELVHTLGFGHEQCRKDRSPFVKIHWDNVNSDWFHAFEKEPDAHSLLKYRIPYDYNSILHYGPFDFSIEPYTAKRPTVTSEVRSFYVHENYHLSPLDLLKINLLYNCTTEIRSWEHKCVDFMPECDRIEKWECDRSPYVQDVCRHRCRRCRYPMLRRR